jgi:hypothetical protein
MMNIKVEGQRWKIAGGRRGWKVEGRVEGAIRVLHCASGRIARFLVQNHQHQIRELGVTMRQNGKIHFMTLRLYRH